VLDIQNKMNTDAVEGGATRAQTYEELRMEKLRRNQQVLLGLGLAQIAQTLSPNRSRSARIPANKNKKRVSALDPKTTPSGPRRRSPRLTGESPLVETGIGAAVHAQESDEEAEEQYAFDPSKVLQYSCFAEDAVAASSLRQGEITDATNLRPVGSGVGDPALKRIYSLSFHAKKPLLAAGGHGGRVAVFSSTCSKKKEDETLLSFKASKGWISGVKFVEEMDCGLLVSSNDGTVSLWDCTVQHDMIPKSVWTASVHGGSGIYHLDVIGDRMVTSGKDGSVCVGTLQSNKMELLRQFDEAHEGVVKSVMFRPNAGGNIVASGGNDTAIRIWDCRSKQDKPSVEMFSSFKLALNIVRWNPVVDHVILSASFANTMELHDTRYPQSKPIQLKGHMPLSCTRASNIYQPIFVNQGKRIIASGGGSKNITMFDSMTGEVLSSGMVGWDSGAFEHSFDGNRIAVSHGKDVSFFDCV
jgi:hypothetical protein